MRSHRIAALVACLFAGACAIGANAKDWAIAKNVRGANVMLYTRAAHVEGELLDVRDDGVVAALQDGRVVFAPWTSMFAITPGKELGQAYQYGSGAANAQAKKNLRLVSHFPEGMSPEIEKRYLDSKGQAALVVLQ